MRTHIWLLSKLNHSYTDYCKISKTFEERTIDRIFAINFIINFEQISHINIDWVCGLHSIFHNIKRPS